MNSQFINLFEIEEAARAVIEPEDFDAVQGGAGDELSVQRARDAYNALLLRQRVLTGLADVDPSTTVLGVEVSLPVIIAPVGFHGRAHPDAEAASARAAAAANTIIVISSSSTLAIEEVGAATNGTKWFQQFLYKDRGLTLSLAQRAADAGFKAICLTLDQPAYPPRRERHQRNDYRQAPSPNYATAKIDALEWDAGGKASRGHNDLINYGATWADFEWFAGQSDLPVVAKGIMTVEDAEFAVQSGATAIVVSNHGARNMDTTQATVEALGPIAQAVGGRCDVLVDGGIRRGIDVLKALASGARAVQIGRPLFYGLAVGGDAGVLRVLEILRDEFLVAMSVCGQRSAASVSPDLLVSQGPRPLTSA